MQVPVADSIIQKARKVINPVEMDKQKVLLVEDEEAHALLERILLERLGFDITICNNGEDAVREYAVHFGKYSFVMTDYTMVPMNGLELAHHLLQVNPSAIILLCSGNDESSLIREAKKIGIRETTLKPTTREEMMNLLISAGLYTPLE